MYKVRESKAAAAPNRLRIFSRSVSRSTTGQPILSDICAIVPSHAKGR
jgi:hypothetical protein